MLQAMAEAGFTMTFLGIESPNDAALTTTVKKQNTHRDHTAREYLLQAIHTIQSYGIELRRALSSGSIKTPSSSPILTLFKRPAFPEPWPDCSQR